MTTERKIVAEIVIVEPKDPQMSAEEEADNIRELMLDALGHPENVTIQVTVLGISRGEVECS